MTKKARYKILVVDDEEDVIISVIESLKLLTKEYEFTKALGGREALEKIESMNFDLVLLDIMMPDVDGWVVVAKIKEKNPNTKVIFVTAKIDDMSRGVGSLSADDYVIKPFELNNLKKRIDKVLKS